MDFLSLLFFVTGTAISLFFGLFSISSLIEKKSRAAFVGGLFFVIYASVWFGGFLIFHPDAYILAGGITLVTVLGILFFMPIGRTEAHRTPAITGRVDERDTMFARYEKLRSLLPNETGEKGD